MEKQLIDDVKKILIETAYFFSLPAVEPDLIKSIDKYNYWKIAAREKYLNDPLFNTVIDRQLIAIMIKIDENIGHPKCGVCGIDQFRGSVTSKNGYDEVKCSNGHLNYLKVSHDG